MSPLRPLTTDDAAPCLQEQGEGDGAEGELRADELDIVQLACSESKPTITTNSYRQSSYRRLDRTTSYRKLPAATSYPEQLLTRYQQALQKQRVHTARSNSTRLTDISCVHEWRAAASLHAAATASLPLRLSAQ